MLWTLIGIIFFLIIILAAFRIGISRKQNEETDAGRPIIHASGIYSIVRRSPREAMVLHKPTEEEIRKYLAQKNEDIEGKRLSADEKEMLVTQWLQLCDINIAQIENGDKDGVEFYFYNVPDNDPVTNQYLKKGYFVTREEIHDFPEIIPPFHLGCASKLEAHRGTENLRETTELGIRPLFRGEKIPSLPNWKDIIKPRQM
jgi:hypothetical protein